jgi:hypothetical protein
MPSQFSADFVAQRVTHFNETIHGLIFIQFMRREFRQGCLAQMRDSVEKLLELIRVARLISIDADLIPFDLQDVADVTVQAMFLAQ